MHPRSIHIAYADEETLFRKTVVAHVLGMAEGLNVVFEGANCMEMLSGIVIGELRPDVCILGAGCIDPHSLREVCEKNPSIKFLVFTKAVHIVLLATMLRLGAKGFVTRNAEPEELVQAVLEVYRNKYFFSSDLVEMHPSISQDTTCRMLNKHLTDSELDLLQWLTTDLTLPEIAARVHLSPRTVEHQCKRLKTKLGVQTRARLSLAAESLGMTPTKCKTKQE